MGEAKALLPVGVGGPSFVSRLTAVFLEGGAADVIVVGRPDDPALAVEVERIATGAAVRLVLNEHADRGQLSSLLVGVNAADKPGVTGVLVCPVDAPMILAASVRTLLAEFLSRRPLIARATHQGRHGHPVIFARRLFDDLRRADPSVGAKDVLRRNAAALIDVELDDPGVVQDIDGPDDYARVFTVRPR
jgi:molybdenum cofactor cytidylyltransferase